jgi:hypothetical protein
MRRGSGFTGVTIEFLGQNLGRNEHNSDYRTFGIASQDFSIAALRADRRSQVPRLITAGRRSSMGILRGRLQLTDGAALDPAVKPYAGNENPSGRGPSLCRPRPADLSGDTCVIAQSYEAADRFNPIPIAGA